jgi:hypothetical protein
LSDLHNCFKSYSATIKRYFGTGLLDIFVTRLPEYTEEVKDDKDELQKNAWEKVLAYGLLDNSDRERYDKLRGSLVEHYANGRVSFL